MPELPEVETIVRGLRKRVKGLQFSRAEIYLGKCVKGPKQSLVLSLRGRRVLDVDRRGKNIIFRLNGGMTFFVHLGMTGRLRVVPSEAPLEKHTHAVFWFASHPRQLRFVDPRQFGRLFWEESEDGEGSALARLGPEPLGISAAEFSCRIREHRREIKPLLLDQRFLAGVGNIYADESLHRAGIPPRTRSDSLTEESLNRLHRALRGVLQESIRAKGTSVRSYVDAEGSAGAFQNSLKVYGRAGRPCYTCGTPIIREKVGGRSSFSCPRCQPPFRAGKRIRQEKMLHNQKPRSKM